MSADDYSSGWQMEGDELVRRLSGLEWAPVPDELRERCWKEFEQRVTQNGNGSGATARSRPAFNVGERYEMRRFAPTRRLAVAELSGRGFASPGRGLAASARLAAAQAGRAHTPPRRALSLG
jgi:hypothetical protein